MPRTPTFAARLASLAELGPDVCWIWPGAVDTSGYGKVNTGRPKRTRGAHRMAYEHLIGPVPDGLQLDHLCRTRLCVNPGHLQPVTPAENVRRGLLPELMARSHSKAGRSVCAHGHPWVPQNVGRLGNGYEYCRACGADRRAAAKARRAA